MASEWSGGTDALVGVSFPTGRVEGWSVGTLACTHCTSPLGESLPETVVFVSCGSESREVTYKVGVEPGAIFHGIEVTYTTCVEKGPTTTGDEIDGMATL